MAERSIEVGYAVASLDSMFPMFRAVYCSRLQRWVGSRFFYKVRTLSNEDIILPSIFDHSLTQHPKIKRRQNMC